MKRNARSRDATVFRLGGLTGKTSVVNKLACLGWNTYLFIVRFGRVDRFQAIIVSHDCFPSAISDSWDTVRKSLSQHVKIVVGFIRNNGLSLLLAFAV